MKKVLLVVCLISVLLLAGCNKNEEANNNVNNNVPEVVVDNQEQQEIIENDNNLIESSVFVSKIENKRDWVYDADYKKDITEESYSTEFNETYFAKDIVVPYINIDSSDAIKANDEIKSIFDSAIKTFNDGIKDKLSYVDECNYRSYINGDVLSIIVTFGEGATDVVRPNYYAYNFDLKTGKKLSFEEVYTLAGFSSNDIDSKVENAISLALQSESLPPQFEQYQSDSISNYKDSLKDNTIQYYLSDNSELNVVVTLSINAGSGLKTTIITVK